jgi:hypothetical protein
MFVPWRPPWMSANKPAPTGTGRPKGGLGLGISLPDPARCAPARTNPEPRRGAVSGLRLGVAPSNIKT